MLRPGGKLPSGNLKQMQATCVRIAALHARVQSLRMDTQLLRARGDDSSHSDVKLAQTLSALREDLATAVDLVESTAGDGWTVGIRESYFTPGPRDLAQMLALTALQVSRFAFVVDHLASCTPTPRTIELQDSQ